MENGMADARHYFSIKGERFKVETIFGYSGSSVSGFTLDAWDKGWNTVRFFPSPAGSSKFKTTKEAKTAIEPGMKKVEAFALKFAGCD